MARKAKKIIKVHNGNKTVYREVNLFPSTGHIVYSGFGIHQKDARAERRQRKIEAKNIFKEDY